MRKIPLRRRDGTVRAYALVDDADFADLGHFRWCFGWGGYAGRWATTEETGQVVLLHRFLLGLEYGDPRQGDHINGDKLDNRRRNLRVVTVAQHRQNHPLQSNNTSGHRGVHEDTRKPGYWIARGCADGKRHFLGSFPTLEEAAAVARAFRLAHMPFAQI